MIRRICQLIPLLVFTTLLLTGCGSNGGESTGLPLYYKSNYSFSSSAINKLKSCGMSNDDIQELARQLKHDAPRGRERILFSRFNQSTSSLEAVANISITEVETGICEISCSPEK